MIPTPSPEFVQSAVSSFGDYGFVILIVFLIISALVSIWLRGDNSPQPTRKNK